MSSVHRFSIVSLSAIEGKYYGVYEEEVCMECKMANMCERIWRNQLTRMAFDFRTKSEGRPGGIRTHVYVFSARVIALARIKNVDIKGKVSKDWGY